MSKIGQKICSHSQNNCQNMVKNGKKWPKFLKCKKSSKLGRSPNSKIWKFPEDFYSNPMRWCSPVSAEQVSKRVCNDSCKVWISSLEVRYFLAKIHSLRKSKSKQNLDQKLVKKWENCGRKWVKSWPL